MLINFNNYEWINKNQIVSMDIEYTIEKPNLLQNVDKAMCIWMKEENNWYYSHNKVNYKILVYKRLNVYFSNMTKKSIVCLVNGINYLDLNITLDKKEDCIGLFYSTMKLNTPDYTKQVNDNSLISFIKKLLKDESKMQETKSFAEFIKEYHDGLKYDIVADEIKAEIIKDIERLYGIHR